LFWRVDGEKGRKRIHVVDANGRTVLKLDSNKAPPPLHIIEYEANKYATKQERPSSSVTPDALEALKSKFKKGRSAAPTSRSTSMTRYRKFHALRGEELDPYEEMNDEQLMGIGHNEFVDLVDDVLVDLERMEAAVKRRQALYDRMRKTRLADMLAANAGKVVELQEMLMQYTEAAGTVSWSNLVKSLKKMRPELSDLLAELEEQHRGKSSPRVLKHRRKDEPKTWKSLEHVPLRESRLRAAQGMDEMAEMRLMTRLSDFLDDFIYTLEAMNQGGMQMAASTKRRAFGEHGYDVVDELSLLRDLDSLDYEMEHLQRFYENGRISESAYYDQMAELEDQVKEAEQALRKFPHRQV
jgi:hypothetical protein